MKNVIMKNSISGVIVEFTSKNTGKVLLQGDCGVPVGTIYEYWTDNDNPLVWKIVPHPQETKPKYKVGDVYRTDDGKGVVTIICTDLETDDKGIRIVGKTKHSGFTGEMLTNFDQNGMQYDILKDNPLDITKRRTLFDDVELYEPVWVKNSKQDPWTIRMFTGFEHDILQTVTDFGSTVYEQWAIYSFKKPKTED